MTECNCTGEFTQTCHPCNPRGHQVGCPCWGPGPAALFELDDTVEFPAVTDDDA